MPISKKYMLQKPFGLEKENGCASRQKGTLNDREVLKLEAETSKLGIRIL